MMRRLIAVAYVTLLEAIRSKLLLAIGLVHAAGTAYAALLAALSLGQEARVIADVGLASLSLVSIALVVVHGATSVDLDLRRKAVLTVLTRALHRSEWIIGKYLGIVAALALFGASGAALTLAVAGFVEGSSSRAALALAVLVPGAVAALSPRLGRAAPLGYAMPLAALTAVVLLDHDPGTAASLRGAGLAMTEAMLVAAVALFFATFSGPIPTGIFTLGVVLVGRSADTLAKLPPKTFPESVLLLGRVLAKALPNLHVFTPPRSVLAGLDPLLEPRALLTQGAAYTFVWAVVLLAGSALVIDRRDLG
jgi:Cu-processing system permease protein